MGIFKVLINEGQLHEITGKKAYFGRCDQVRKTCRANEEEWHVMMANKQAISDEEFLAGVQDYPLLEEDETMEEWLEYAHMEDPDAQTYKSMWGDEEVYFLQASGFEFIFK